MKTNVAVSSNYTTPKINTGTEWFIWFRFLHDGEWKLIKRKEGLNRIKSKKERMEAAAGLCEAREKWLKEGWNPVIDPEFKLKKITKTDERKKMLFGAALEFAKTKITGLAGKTARGYKNQVDLLLKYADKHGYTLLQISEVDRGILLELLDKCSEECEWSNHNYNKHAATLRRMFSYLVEYRVVNFNPLLDFKGKQWVESNKYDTYTEDEKSRIARHLLNEHYNLYRVMQLIYHTGIRPKEALALTIADIDLRARLITIAPDLEKENSKDKDVRRVPINNHLLDLFGTMKLHNFPGHFYVFGSPFQPGKGNRGAGSQKWFEGIDRPGRESGKKYVGGRCGIMRDDFLMPSKYHTSRDSVTELWRRLVIEQLGIKKHLYAAKHTGTDDKIEAGLSLKDLQIMYGHESEEMTKRYNKKKRQIEANEEILRKSPDFISPPKLKKVA